MSNPTIKTPKSKQDFREMVSNLAPSESINWQLESWERRAKWLEKEVL